MFSLGLFLSISIALRLLRFRSTCSTRDTSDALLSLFSLMSCKLSQITKPDSKSCARFTLLPERKYPAASRSAVTLSKFNLLRGNVKWTTHRYLYLPFKRCGTSICKEAKTGIDKRGKASITQQINSTCWVHSGVIYHLLDFKINRK